MQQRPLRILVVDDEEPARRKTVRFLDRCPEPKVVVEAANGQEAVWQLESGGIDMVLLDIQMPEMNGFDVIQAIGVDAMPPVVFITAWDGYAVEAFAVEAVDYLLKPFDFDRFRRAFERALRAIASPRAEADRLSRLLGQLSRSQPTPTRLLVHEGDRLVFLRIDEIQVLVAADKYVEVVTHRQLYRVRETLAKLEKRLPPDRFVRVHRSYVVNLDAVAELSPWAHGDYVIRLKNGQKVPVSRRYADRVLSH